MNQSHSNGPVRRESSGDGPWTVQRVMAWSIEYLRSRGEDRPRLDVEQLLAAVLDFDRIQLYTQFDRPLTSAERLTFREMLMRRSRGEPVAYILGFREFFGHRFKVNSSTLIPRPDTEVLVEKAALEIERSEGAVRRILDIGTGSGCIAISLAHRFPDVQVVAVDVSPAALEVARDNIALHQIPNVQLICCDVTEGDFWQRLDPVDLIVSNPPYIAQSERCDLPVSVLDFEPELALFAQNEGLFFYELIRDHANRILRESGRVFVEVGYRQSAVVAQLFEAAGFRGVSVFPDYGGIPRVVAAARSST